MRRHGFLELIFAVFILVISVGCNNKPIPNVPKQHTKITPPQRLPTSGYLRKGHSNMVVVFVHGLFGDAEHTWTCDSTGISWPNLLLKDPIYDNADIYVAQYRTPRGGGTLDIGEIAQSLRNSLERDRVFKDHEEVFVVAHSLGGLVVKKMLLGQREFAHKVHVIFFFGTPMMGAKIAGFAAQFSGDPVLEEMRKTSKEGYLFDLSGDWKNAKLKIRAYCGYETKSVKDSVFVVSRESATYDCRRDFAIPENHIEIVKPCSDRDESYLALSTEYQHRLSHIERLNQKGAQKQKAALNSQEKKTKPKRLG